MVQAAVMAGTETPDHHGSHRRLLLKADNSSSRARVDAIIVPTARPVAYLKEAGRLAMFLRCPLVTLHSPQWTTAQEASHYLNQSIDLIAINVPDRARLQLPELETSQLLVGTIFERRTDVSAKRNLALVLSRVLGWKRVVFLDDDIEVPDADDLSKAVGLLDAHTVVGLGVGGFPDNSVVCHAFREAGGSQETFIGGGALAVEVERSRSFFPNIYNDDWFYVLDVGGRLQPLATVGRAVQNPYDPFRPERARAEELGDVLAEGAFWLLDQRKPVSDGGLKHWQEFLQRRRRFIEYVIGKAERATALESADRERMVKALDASLERLALIEPELCLAYMQAWENDQELWQRHIQSIKPQPQLPRADAVRSLAKDRREPLTWRGRPQSPERERPTATEARHPLSRELRSAFPIPP